MTTELENMNEHILSVDEKISKLIDKLEDELNSIIEDTRLELEEISRDLLG